MQELLERLDLGEPRERAAASVPGASGWRKAPRLDLLAQPHPLLVARDVLDLIGQRAAVGRAGDTAAPRPASAPGTATRSTFEGICRHHLGREAERAGIERRIADRLTAQRIEVRREVPVRAERLDQRHGGRDVALACRRAAGPRRPGGTAEVSAAAIWQPAERRPKLSAPMRLVKPILPLQQPVQRARGTAPDSAPWMTRWS